MGEFPDFVIPGDVETPAVCIDSQRMDANIHRMSQGLAEKGVAFRPHVKSHKSLVVARHQVVAGAVGLTSATLGEAEVFVHGGFEDIFIAYPLWLTPDKLARLNVLLRQARIAVGVSSCDGARQMVSQFQNVKNLRILIEVDSGENRTGVTRPDEAIEIADVLVNAGMSVTGVFTHGGHSYAGAGAVEDAAADESRSLTAIAIALRGAGHRIETLSAGSTPTALSNAATGITEERPGTFVFGDRQQVTLGAHPANSVALYVLATVVQSSPQQFVLDAGGKVFTKDSPKTLEGFGALPAYPEAVVERLFDHHATVAVRGGKHPRVGEKVAVIPNHVCPVSNLTREFVVVDGDGHVVDRWPVDAGIQNR